jgi:hypothetical protein
MRLIQFTNSDNERKTGIVEDFNIHVLDTVSSVYELFEYAEEQNTGMEESAMQLRSNQSEDYDKIISEQRLLLPLTHPDPYHTWVTGTGLTHLGSAVSRNKMHEAIQSGQTLTDSMKMFRMGEENGKMLNGIPASQPEWFYKGNGLITVAPGQPISSPSFALDGGEEHELAGLYIINKKGQPVRIGFSLGNEFSDHVMEKINYLYLAHSKLRQCSYGPEILLGELPPAVNGISKVIRNNNVIWEKQFLTGEANMSHNIANLEHHHFKYKLFRQPGDVHVHFFGTSVLSFLDNITTAHGDVFEISAPLFGKPLQNALDIES